MSHPLSSQSSCARTPNIDSDRPFYEQTATPISVIGGTARSFILLDDGSLWSFGWFDDGRHNSRDSFIYWQIPVHLMDDVAEIVISDFEIFAIMSDGERIDVGRQQQGFELSLIDGEIFASGSFLRGHLRPDRTIYSDIDGSSVVWSNGTFFPNQQILSGFWYIFETSYEELTPFGHLEGFGYRFLDNGKKVVFLTSPTPGQQSGEIVFLDGEYDWVIMEDGRLKISYGHEHEIFDMLLFRNQSSAGIIDELRLSNGDSFKILLRLIE